mmetsp:Transcript_58242/g.161011  ORF Transcript_58242/g.161011 Transcript_58242/m.161011 type:complete len:413 (-) Transcript_58242:282-1520(-)|eukprot:CAMPEP_0179075226 /NCGR_PEP_ID=MMETSP0796-20121207/33486_1 /TAXON_ID=73915 /ORGANISM="Pyrodinium bahamense, Strain pbaha01" /LENGTH=412 /DNA_ID=CAMNT_0020772461 /DNA_START=60 /DNA_END=1298 /DNA_ORIENTATION=-
MVRAKSIACRDAIIDHDALVKTNRMRILSSEQHESAMQAHGHAIAMVLAARRVAKSEGSEETALVDTWFKGGIRGASLESHLETCERQLREELTLFESACGGDVQRIPFQQLYGFTYARDGRGAAVVYLGPKFWQAEPTGMDSRADTIVHEVTHLCLNTKDIAYGREACLALSPQDAVCNADNFSYFCAQALNLCLTGVGSVTDCRLAGTWRELTVSVVTSQRLFGIKDHLDIHEGPESQFSGRLRQHQQDIRGSRNGNHVAYSDHPRPLNCMKAKLLNRDCMFGTFQSSDGWGYCVLDREQIQRRIGDLCKVLSDCRASTGESLNGIYAKSERATCNGKPLYLKGDMRIYFGKDRRWWVTNTHADIALDTGYGMGNLHSEEIGADSLGGLTWNKLVGDDWVRAENGAVQIL